MLQGFIINGITTGEHRLPSNTVFYSLAEHDNGVEISAFV